MTRIFSRYVVLLVLPLVIGILIGIRAGNPYPVEKLRLSIFDYYQKLMPRIPEPAWQKTSPVVIVDIDEKSLAEYGQFPWSRHVMAELVNRLNAAGATAIGFDILFAEPDRASPKSVIASLQGLDYPVSDAAAELAAIDFDAVFAQSIAQAPVVLGQIATHTATSFKEPRGNETSVKAMLGGDATPSLEHFNGAIHNLPILEKAANFRGLLSLSSRKIDEIVRWIPLAAQVDGVIKPAMSIEMLRLALGSNMLMLKSNPSGIDSVTLLIKGQHLDIPTAPHARVWVYFAQPDRHNTPENSGRMYVSAADILKGRYPPERLAGRLALLGTSAAGLVDLRATPVSPALPGVEVHANIIENILAQDFLQYPAWIMFVELIALSIGLGVLTLLLLRASPWFSLLVLILFIGGFIATSLYLYRFEKILFDAGYPMLSMLGLYTMMTFWRFRQNALEKQQVRSAFGQYLSPALVEQLAEDPSRLTLGGERKDMTLLFCDIRGFTGISEAYRDDPEGLTTLINRLLTPLSEVILDHEGTVDKYMGDCIMAFWNAPMETENHAGLALRSAQEMHRVLAELNDTLAEEAKTDGRAFSEVNIGIGMNSGTVVVGNMGSEQRFDYSVLGDSVNLAARLEGQSKQYRVGTVIGEDSRAFMTEAEQATLFELDLIAVKGKAQAVRIFTSLMDIAPEQRQKLMVHQQVFLLAYRGMQWQEAARLARQGMEMPELRGYYDCMAERIADYQAHPPPPDWDGVYRATEK